MLKACCGNSQFHLTKSNSCHITELFLLYITDQITDLLVILHWYKYEYHTYFITGSTIFCISCIIQWLYCTWNCNEYLQNLIKRHYHIPNNIPQTHCCASSLMKTTIGPLSKLSSSPFKRDTNIERWKRSIYITDDDDDDSLCSEYGFEIVSHSKSLINTISHSTLYTTLCFIVKCIWHLCNGGMIELYLTNIRTNSNRIMGAFIDVLHLHVLFQSILMSPLMMLFALNHSMDITNAYDILLLVLSLILSCLCTCIFTVNFEKFRYMPLYDVQHWQFSKHNIVAIYWLFIGDFILRCMPCVLLTFSSDISVYFVYIFAMICVLLSVLLCVVYHIMCWWRWGFLYRKHWIYEHYPYLEYQILNPMLNIMDISAILGCFLRQVLFIYAVLISNISVIGYIYFRPVVTQQHKECKCITKCIRLECFVRYCLGIIILGIVLSVNYRVNIVILVLCVLCLMINMMLVHNISDTPLIYIDLCGLNDDNNDIGSSSYLKLNTMDFDDYMDNEYQDHRDKRSKIHCCCKYMIKLSTNYYNLKDNRCNMEPWNRFSLKAKWELNALGYWDRNEIKRRKHADDNDSDFMDEDDEGRIDKEDPFYGEYEIMNLDKERIDSMRHFMSHFVSYCGYRDKWNARCIEEGERNERSERMLKLTKSRETLRDIECIDTESEDGEDGEDEEKENIERNRFQFRNRNRNGKEYHPVRSASRSSLGSKSSNDNDKRAWHQKKQASSKSLLQLSQSIPEEEEVDM